VEGAERLDCRISTTDDNVMIGLDTCVDVFCAMGTLARVHYWDPLFIPSKPLSCMNSAQGPLPPHHSARSLPMCYSNAAACTCSKRCVQRVERRARGCVHRARGSIVCVSCLSLLVCLLACLLRVPHHPHVRTAIAPMPGRRTSERMATYTTLRGCDRQADGNAHPPSSAHLAMHLMRHRAARYLSFFWCLLFWFPGVDDSLATF
jgi:hypothetical protein